MVDYDRNSSAQQMIVMTQARADPRSRRTHPPSRLGAAHRRLRVRPGDERHHRGAAGHRDVPDRPPGSSDGGVPRRPARERLERAVRPRLGPVGIPRSADGVRTEAAVGSFYEQMVAEASVDFGTCFAASHWLEHAVRLHSPGTLWFADLTGAARREMAEQARRDWTRFLSQRAKELRSGGFLFVSTLGSVPDVSEINGTAASGRGIYRALQVVAQGMADDGLIDRFGTRRLRLLAVVPDRRRRPGGRSSMTTTCRGPSASSRSRSNPPPRTPPTSSRSFSPIR